MRTYHEKQFMAARRELYEIKNRVKGRADLVFASIDMDMTRIMRRDITIADVGKNKILGVDQQVP